MAEREVVKALKLNLLPLSKRKEHLLAELFDSVASCCNDVLSIAKSINPDSFVMLHTTSYAVIKQKYNLHSQILVDCIHQVWENLKTNPDEFKQVPVRFNVPRSGRFAETKRGNPVVVISSFNGNGRIALPIKQDGAYRRFLEHLKDDWICTQFRLHKESGHYVVIADLRKKFRVKTHYQAVVGVDVNSGNFALTVVGGGGKVLKQLYLGQDIWHRQWKFMKRRSKLRSYVNKGSRKARRALRKIKHDERNFTSTRTWQIAHEIVGIAAKYNAVIAIEKLKNLRRNGKAKKPKKANRKIHRIPFAKFRMAVQSVAWQNGIDIAEVPAAKTSQKCPRCGYTSKKNWIFFENKRKLFKCKKCGYEANPDRTASRNIATLALERGTGFSKAICTKPQFSRAGGAVSHPNWLDEEVRWHRCSSESKLPSSDGRS